MTRRFLRRGLAVLAAAVVVVGVTAVAAGGFPRPADRSGTGYDDSSSTRPEMHQRPDGTWESYLLPFAAPFPTKEALEQALAKAREEGLIR